MEIVINLVRRQKFLIFISLNYRKVSEVVGVRSQMFTYPLLRVSTTYIDSDTNTTTKVLSYVDRFEYFNLYNLCMKKNISLVGSYFEYLFFLSPGIFIFSS